MTPPVANSGFPVARVILLTLLAALLAMVFWFGADIMALRTKVAALETERDMAKTEAALAQSLLKERTLLAEGMINDLQRQLREKDALAMLRIIRLSAPEGGGATGMLVWDPQEGAAAFVGSRLELPAANETYRLWLTNGASRTHYCVGDVTVLADGTATAYFRTEPKVRLADVVTVTVEVASSTAASGRIILSSK